MLNAVNIILVDDDDAVLEYYVNSITRRQTGLKTRLVARRRKRRKGEVEEFGDGGFKDENEFVTYSASTGRDAVALAEKLHARGESIAVGFFDMRMTGGMDGFETIKAVKEIFPALHCAIASAYTDREIDDFRMLFRAPSEWIYLSKPFPEEELLEVLDRLIASHRHATEERDTEEMAGAALVEWY